MEILNKEELRKQIKEGKEISLDGILDEFKSLLRESIQTDLSTLNHTQNNQFLSNRFFL